MDDDRVTLRDYTDQRCDELARRLDESAVDREHVREGIGARATRLELGLVIDRVSKLETQISRLYGGLAVVGLVLAALALLLRYVVGH